MEQLHLFRNEVIINTFNQSVYYYWGRRWKIITSTGTTLYYDDDCIYHKDDGPAIIYPNGKVEYYIHGKKLSEEKHREMTRKPPDLLTLTISSSLLDKHKKF